MRDITLYTALACLMLTGCAKEKEEPVVKLKPYQSYIQNAEAVIYKGSTLGVIYVHPIRKTSCNTMKAQLSRLDYNGVEKFWVKDQHIEIKEQMSAPIESRKIGSHPVFFEMKTPGRYRIDALSCVGFDQKETPQYQVFADFEAHPRKVMYIGDFQQANLAKTVDLYIPSQDLENAKQVLAKDSPDLSEKLISADTTFFKFQNFNGKDYSAADVMENAGQSGDYFTLSQTLRSQSNQAWWVFTPLIPSTNVSRQVRNPMAAFEKNLTQNLKAAFLRQDLLEEFHTLIAKKKSYDTAIEYVNHKLDVENARRRIPKTNFKGNQEYQTAAHNLKKAEDKLDAYMKSKRLSALLGDRLSEERVQARKAWLKEMKRMPFVLTSKFSSYEDVVMRDQVSKVLSDYTPKKYASLRYEFTALAERSNLDLSDQRRLKILLDIAETQEMILLEELIRSFQRESLTENDTYKAASGRHARLWKEIYGIQHQMGTPYSTR